MERDINQVIRTRNDRPQRPIKPVKKVAITNMIPADPGWTVRITTSAWGAPEPRTQVSPVIAWAILGTPTHDVPVAVTTHDGRVVTTEELRHDFRTCEIIPPNQENQT